MEMKFIFFLILLFNFNISKADEKITTSPLINLEEIKPSFESSDAEIENFIIEQNLKEKKKINKLQSSKVILLGLDKITAKSSEMIVNLNESKKYGP